MIISMWLKLINKRHEISNLIAHALGWLFLLLLPLVFMPFHPLLFLRASLQTFLLAILFYMNMHLFIPRFLYRRKYSTYLLVLTASLVFILVSIWIYNKVVNFDFVRFNAPPDDFFRDRPKPPLFKEMMPVVLMSLLIIAISSSFEVLKGYLEKERRITEIENQKLSAELSVLKLQINPHFFFNTLNSIYYLANKKSALAPKAILMLSDLMRYPLYEATANKVLLKKEVNYIQNFIDLQTFRLHKNVHVSFNITGNMEGYKIEPMLILPFIENTFKHGVVLGVESDIEIDIKTHDGKLELSTSNPIIDNPEKEIGGIGLVNSKKRLELSYPSNHRLDIVKSDGRFKVCLILNLNNYELPDN